MFNNQQYNQQYLSNPSNDAAQYGVTISPANVGEGEAYWKVIGIHHLLPLENMSNHHVFLEVLNEQGQRVSPARAGWTWEGRRPDERADPVLLDKPIGEAAGNIAIFNGQIISVWVSAAEKSEVVKGLSTRHSDEALPDGRLFNTFGHHSFYVVFHRARGGQSPAPIDPPKPLTLEDRVALLESQMAMVLKERS